MNMHIFVNIFGNGSINDVIFAKYI